MPKSIQQQFFYTHPVESVWDYLTNPELLSLWLMPTNFKPVLGHEFQFTTKPMPHLQSDGVFHCKIVEIIPLKKLSYTWKSGPGNGDISLDTLVVWTLTEKDNGTALELDHSGFHEKHNLDIYAGMLNGWKQKMENIAERLNTAKHGTSNG